MRTTLDIDGDVLDAVKQIAAQRGVSAGKVLSELGRNSLRSAKTPKTRNGVLLIARLPGSAPVTMEMVIRYRG